MSETTRPLVSIICPVFNEEPNIARLHQRLCAVLAGLEDRFEFEIIFTDNCSTDRTFDLLEDLARRDPRIRAFRFSRNFGFQRSILTGYLKARGAAAVQIDADLQDPPELIADFLEHWRQGCDVVYGVRRRRRESGPITFARKVFYRLIDRLSEDRLPHDAGDFRLISRRVLDALAQVDDYHPYLRGLVASFGFRQHGIEYDRDARTAGESKFPLRALISLAIDGILAHSIVPLRLASITAIIMGLGTLLGIIGYAGSKMLFNTDWPPGFATTTVLLLFGITLNALFLGVIGEYLGRIYQQVKRRPLTIIERSIDSTQES
jgi:polyisoprenyl-phosphate glycosyltransferase